ncbi:DUF819 family protein [Lysobacter sp. F60174L2]|uniref:DUF819 family protein n=1 Tax=Lysobacter sp. F60174L2 TaxID=3459295 RepID=UPI00403D8840
MTPAASTALITNDAVILGLLAVTLGAVFWTASRPSGFWHKFYSYVPALLMCYLVPAIFNTVGLIDSSGSGLYPMARDYLLPSALVLFCVAMDFGAIVRLGPKALIMFLTGTVGVMLGAVISLVAIGIIHPPTVGGETWRGMTTIAGSWIGGGANQAAMKEVFQVDANLFGQFIAVDVIVAYFWMAILLFLAPRAKAFDRWTGADASAIENLQQRMASYQAEHERVPSMSDLMLIFAAGIGLTGLSHLLADPLVAWVQSLPAAWNLQDYSLDSRFFWIVVFATTFGVLLSLTRARRLEGAGASNIGSVMLYVLIATIGMQMDLKSVVDRPMLLLLGVIWISVHAALMLGVAKLIRAPLFFLAVGSQANIGGAASAPVVASAFHPALAPVGVLLAVLGYALGTYCAYITGLMLQAIAT